MILVLGVEEGVALASEQRLMDVHAAAVLVGQGLGHERGVDAVPHGDFLDNQAIGHGAVGHSESVGVAQIDLVLAGGHLVVTGLHTDAHLLQGQDGLPPQVGSGIQGGEVEVAAPIQNGGALGVGEVEVL